MCSRRCSVYGYLLTQWPMECIMCFVIQVSLCHIQLSSVPCESSQSTPHKTSMISPKRRISLSYMTTLIGHITCIRPSHLITASCYRALCHAYLPPCFRSQLCEEKLGKYASCKYGKNQVLQSTYHHGNKIKCIEVGQEGSRESREQVYNYVFY